MNNPIIGWLQETLQRVFTKSPKFFKVWIAISGLLVLVTSLPNLIDFLNISGINIPNIWNDKVTLAVGWAAKGVLLMSILTTQSKAEGITTNGKVLKITNEEKLPFTANFEKKSAIEKGVDLIEVNTIPAP